MAVVAFHAVSPFVCVIASMTVYAFGGKLFLIQCRSVARAAGNFPVPALEGKICFSMVEIDVFP